MRQVTRPGESPVMLLRIDALGTSADLGPEATRQVQRSGWCAAGRAQIHARPGEQPGSRDIPSRSVIARHRVRPDEPLTETERASSLDDRCLGAADVGDQLGAPGERSGATEDVAGGVDWDCYDDQIGAEV